MHLRLLSKVNRLTKLILIIYVHETKLSKSRDWVIKNSQLKP